MDLADYMTATGRTNADLSRLLRVNPSYVSLLVAGKRHPSIEVAQRIEQVTGQTVTLEDWIIRRRQNPRPWAGDNGAD